MRADLDDHLTLLWLVSFALLIKADAATWLRLLALLDQAGPDALLDRVVASRTPGRAVSAHLNHPDIFMPLLLALNVQHFDQAAQLGRYVGAWYRKMADTCWHDAHKGPEGGGFVGYWAIEAAGVCAAFGLPAGSLAQRRYFPADLLG